jgi:hypothetical protein
LVLIDAQIYDVVVRGQRGGMTPEMNFLNWLPTLIATPGWFLLNFIPIHNLKEDPDNAHVIVRARLFMFASFVILFVAITCGAIVMIVNLSTLTKIFYWGHVCTILHPVCITFSAIIYFFGRLVGHMLRCGNREDY